MIVLLIVGIWITICILTAFLLRWLVVKLAKRNGYNSNDMPIIYHIIAVGAYFTIIYPALFLLIHLS